ncbi:MAG: NADP-dependent oxidoreductase [Alphaproteobacteria bacterium]
MTVLADANRSVVLAERPAATSAAPIAPREADFALVESALAAPGPGEVLLENLYLSLDPYMAAYLLGQHPLGVAVEARVASRVVASRNPALAPGDLVWGFFGWEDYTLLPASLRDRKGYSVLPNRIDPARWPPRAPFSNALSVLGMPGLTAHVGLVDIARPRPGETVFVSSAAGALGQIVGQIARIAGCRVVGSAGGPAKVAYLEALGFDAAFDYRAAEDLEATLRRHCADGIDIYFDNVGGATLDAALALANDHARFPLCGMISTYGEGGPEGVVNMFLAVRKRITLTGFTIYDHYPGRMAAYLDTMIGWMRAGEVRYTETIVEGLENLPAAFIAMLAGRHGIGKCLVKLAPDPLQD